jgi:endo-1,4-beta-D-glucanase Y
MSQIRYLSLALIIAVIPPGSPAAGLQSGGGERNGAYRTGVYPNLFTELLAIPRAAVKARLDSAFQQLFYGDDGSGRVYYPAGTDMAYVVDVANNDVRSEGMSYGMMIAVQLDRKAEFDRLWKWAKTFMQFGTGPHKGYFGWHCRTDGTLLDSTAASDGEAWFVMSLYFASARWGDGNGIYAYRAEADRILQTMLHKEDEPGHGSVTNMFNAGKKLVAFVPSTGGNSFTDPSYQLPHFYELWSRWGAKDNRFWCDAASASRQLLKAAAHPSTGLSPDYSTFDGKPVAGWRGGHDEFRFDAWRVAMNAAMDWLWFRKDPWQVEQSNRLLDFFHSQGIGTYGNQFTLGGKRLGEDHSTGLVAMNAVACLASTNANRKEFVREFWNSRVPSGQYRYYDGMLYLLGFLQVSGNFRIYEPAGGSFADCPPGETGATGGSSIGFEKEPGSFPLADAGKSAPLCASSRDFPGVLRVLKLLQNDIAEVTGTRPGIAIDRLPPSKEIVLIGTLGRHPQIDMLVKGKKIDVRGIAGAWEASLVQVVEKPFPGVDRALVIAGSDKRGTIYGMFGISERIGVSPWYWWADVPVKRHESVFVLPGRHSDGPPSVRYRGIFLNDEFPALSKWVRGTYGEASQRSNPPVPRGVANYGHQFYERIFEVLLRLKANYLWPAMWDNAFNEDDPENPKLADEYGIVMGTSHQEPMLRAQKEWDRRYKRSLGSWNYAKYPDTLESFWREGIRRNRAFESIVTIGLRGADDTPMAPGGPEANMALLEKIIGIQRNILGEEFRRAVTTVPQLWCLYKEVLEFYKAGMRAPDDVTLLWPDDNWGNIRRLPTAQERQRSGGAGIYYHFDYHGSPRSYQWINTNPLPKVMEQMSLAKDYGADRIWIVNVGHFKGYELPTEYFLALAWDTKRWAGSSTSEFTRLWAEREFGSEHASDIADIVSTYAKFNGRRKPELLTPRTYSLVNYREAQSVVADFNALAERATGILGNLPTESKDAFEELVLFPAKASAIVNELYVAAGLNALYAKQGRAAANEMAAKTRTLFSADTALMGYFNRTLAGGKWNHFMDQAHLGYTTWADPPVNSLGAIPLTELAVPAGAAMGVAVEGSDAAWPGAEAGAVLPAFDPFNDQQRSIEIFNRGQSRFQWSATPSKPWIALSAAGGELDGQTELRVRIDWSTAPRTDDSGTVTVTGTGVSVPVRIRFSRPAGVTPETLDGFIEGDGYVSMEAAHFTRSSESGVRRWAEVEEYGHTLSAMRASAPPDLLAAVPGKDSPCLEYRMYLLDSGRVNVTGTFGTTLNFRPGEGVRYAISFDDAPAATMTLVPHDFIAQHGDMDWEKTVADNARYSTTTHVIAAAGYHTLKIWMVDPGVVLEKIVVNCGGVRPSYLGPPESFHR